MASSPEVLQLIVSTPKGKALETETDSVQAPSVFGEFGVLPGHRPLLAALQCGVLHYETAGKSRFAAVGPGFVQAEPSQVRLLTDLFALPEDIETDVVQAELAEAEEALSSFPDLYEGPDYRELQRNVNWALARIEALTLADA